MFMRLFARAVVKYRWAVIGLWVVIGAIAMMQARHTPERLDLRGGSTRETEAVLADRLLQGRFSRSIGEFFAITLEAPSPIDRPGPAAVLDSLIAVLRREPYVRSILSYPTLGDSLFISKDGRTTLILAALGVPGAEAGKYVVPARKAIQRALATFPDAGDYRVIVTGRAALDLDIRSVSADDSRRSEVRVLPLTLMVLVLAFACSDAVCSSAAGVLKSSAVSNRVGFTSCAGFLLLIVAPRF